MFHTFFPKPKLYFLSFTLWSISAIVFWYLLAQDAGPSLSLASLIGVHFPQALTVGANSSAKAAFEVAMTEAKNAWFYQYLCLASVIFTACWLFVSRHKKWACWSILGSAFIVMVTWFQVHISVLLNSWYGSFYDLIQKALGKPKMVSIVDFYQELTTVAVIIAAAVIVAVINQFFVSHFVFRWRTAMTEYYTHKWQHVRHIEGASQRIQEDTMRFANIMENLGVSFLNSIMTLLAFLPILWGLSRYVTELPLIGEVPQALVLVAIVWSIFGTALLALVGIRLPGLEFRNQRVEAGYRKELVYGEDFTDRAQPETLVTLFDRVRKSYFRLYFNYLYFNIVRYSYINVGQFIPLIALAPSIVAGAFTLGIMQRIINSFRQVENSFQYLVNAWPTIVEMLSIYKRLKTFEASINETEIPEIERYFEADETQITP